MNTAVTSRKVLTKLLVLISVVSSFGAVAYYARNFPPPYHEYVKNGVSDFFHDSWERVSWWSSADAEADADGDGLPRWKNASSSLTENTTDKPGCITHRPMHGASNQSTTFGFEGFKTVRIQALNGLIKRRLSLARSYRDTVRRHDKVKNFSTTRFLTHEFEHGRLGNWMFQAASLIGIARQNHRVPIILKSQKERSQLFEAFHLTLVDPGSLFSTTAGELNVFPLPNSRAAIYDATTENLTATCRCQNQMMVLSGYLQSWKYFNTSRNEIRQMFTFRQGVYNRAMKHITDGLNMMKARSSQVTLIGVHVRRGDLLDPNFNEIGHIPATDKYILNTMRHFQRKNCAAVFFVVTDDAAYCRAFLSSEFPNVVLVEGNHRRPEVDMALLTLMDHLLLTVGSFGWWGAYLSDAEEIVHFQDWPRNGSSFERQMRKEDFFPPNWLAWS